MAAKQPRAQRRPPIRCRFRMGLRRNGPAPPRAGDLESLPPLRSRADRRKRVRPRRRHSPTGGVRVGWRAGCGLGKIAAGCLAWTLTTKSRRSGCRQSASGSDGTRASATGQGSCSARSTISGSPVIKMARFAAAVAIAKQSASAIGCSAFNAATTRIRDTPGSSSLTSSRTRDSVVSASDGPCCLRTRY